MKSWFSVLFAAGTLATSTANAIPFFEVGDAGQSLSDAEFVGGRVNSIFGKVDGNSADLFSFYWSGGAFAADTFGSVADTELFLFNADGQGVWANDEVANGVHWSKIIDPVLRAGKYFVGISAFDYDPYSAVGPMFKSAPFDGLFPALNDSPLDHWERFHISSGGDYVVNFRVPTAASEPPMFALFGVALGALGWAKRRRHAST